MRSHTLHDVLRPTAVRRAVVLLGAALALSALVASAHADPAPLRVAVYNVPPYGQVEPDGAVDGVSVDLWRRVAGAMQVGYKLVPVANMEAVLAGLERGEYDVAIGAITITPERLARVDFSYPAHASGVAAAFPRAHGPTAAVETYAATIADLAPLIGITMGLLVAMGIGMWLAERPKGAPGHESAVATLRDGVYWAVVTMTTVGYGDKTPKTTTGRGIAVVWMLASVALVSILSTTIVSKMTAERVSGERPVVESDLAGKRIAAVAHSSGAEFLEARKIGFAPFDSLPSALASLVRGDADAVVNSVGALQYAIRTGFAGKIDPPTSVLAPAFLAFALPPGAPLKKRLDKALIEITASAEWRRVEASYFAP